MCNGNDQDKPSNERPPEVEAPDLVPVLEGCSNQEKPESKED